MTLKKIDLLELDEDFLFLPFYFVSACAYLPFFFFFLMTEIGMKGYFEVILYHAAEFGKCLLIYLNHQHFLFVYHI